MTTKYIRTGRHVFNLENIESLHFDKNGSGVSVHFTSGREEQYVGDVAKHLNWLFSEAKMDTLQSEVPADAPV